MSTDELHARAMSKLRYLMGGKEPVASHVGQYLSDPLFRESVDDQVAEHYWRDYLSAARQYRENPTDANSNAKVRAQAAYWVEIGTEQETVDAYLRANLVEEV